MRGTSLFLSTGLASALALSACGPSLGEPKMPTSSQTQAAKQLDGTTTQVSQLQMDRGAAFSLFGSINAVGPQAAGPSAKSSALLQALTNPLAVDDKCVTGDGNTGWTYACTEVTGTVKFSGGTTTIDLKIMASGSGSSIETTFKGSVTNGAGKLTGDLTAETKVNLGISLPGVPNADVKTHVNYDINYTASPACVNAGKILVEYSAAGQNGAAQFEYTGCNTFMVRNS
jgi:hypothetical protein